MRLLTIFTAERINLQHVLYFTAFLAFGIGDGITAAFMMDKSGIGIEVNPIAGFLFMTQGFYGFVIAKIWLTFALLLGTHILQLRSPGYWTINGFLIALTSIGLMAVKANLTATAGGIPESPGTIIFTYLVLTLVLIEVGSLIDEHKARTAGYYSETV